MLIRFAALRLEMILRQNDPDPFPVAATDG
jgi:hypothetical protein